MLQRLTIDCNRYIRGNILVVCGRVRVCLSVWTWKEHGPTEIYWQKENKRQRERDENNRDAWETEMERVKRKAIYQSYFERRQRCNSLAYALTKSRNWTVFVNSFFFSRYFPISWTNFSITRRILSVSACARVYLIFFSGKSKLSVDVMYSNVMQSTRVDVILLLTLFVARSC